MSVVVNRATSDEPYDAGDPKVVAEVTLRLVMSLGQCTEEQARRMIAAYAADDFDAYQTLSDEAERVK